MKLILQKIQSLIGIFSYNSADNELAYFVQREKPIFPRYRGMCD